MSGVWKHALHTNRTEDRGNGPARRERKEQTANGMKEVHVLCERAKHLHCSAPSALPPLYVPRFYFIIITIRTQIIRLLKSSPSPEAPARRTFGQSEALNSQHSPTLTNNEQRFFLLRRDCARDNCEHLILHPNTRNLFALRRIPPHVMIEMPTVLLSERSLIHVLDSFECE